MRQPNLWKTGLMSLTMLFAVAALAPAPAQAALLEAVGCPNTDDEFRTGSAQCAFSCGGSDTVSVSASSSQKLEEIHGEASCGGASAVCHELSSDDCDGDSGSLTTYAQSEGACKATGFDPWWAGRYDLTADCSGNTWTPPGGSPKSGCNLGKMDGKTSCLTAVHLAVIVMDGNVVEASGVFLETGQTFKPVVTVVQTLSGRAITVST